MKLKGNEKINTFSKLAGFWTTRAVAIFSDATGAACKAFGNGLREGMRLPHHMEEEPLVEQLASEEKPANVLQPNVVELD